jgi:hypothetical protein
VLSVSYPYRIHLIRIRIQHFRLNAGPDTDPVRIQGFYDQKFKKIYSSKKLIFLGSKTAIYLPVSLSLHKGRSSYIRCLQPPKRDHPALQNMKFLNFSTFVGNFCPPESGSVSLIVLNLCLIYYFDPGCKNQCSYLNFSKSALVFIHFLHKNICVFYNVFISKLKSITADPDPHHFGRPDPHESEIWICKVIIQELWRLKWSHEGA